MPHKVPTNCTIKSNRFQQFIIQNTFTSTFTFNATTFNNKASYIRTNYIPRTSKSVLMIKTISLEGKNISAPKIGDFFFLFLKYEHEHKLKYI